MINRVIERFVEAEASPAEIAGELNLSLHQLAELTSQESNLQTLQNLARLADMRTQMLLSKYRANAAVHLITIATAKEPTELSRKACVDLLKTNLGAFENVGSAISAAEPPVTINEEVVLKALEELGNAAETERAATGGL